MHASFVCYILNHCVSYLGGPIITDSGLVVPDLHVAMLAC